MQTDDYIRFRLPKELKEALYDTCKKDYKSVSEVLRDFVIKYVKKANK